MIFQRFKQHHIYKRFIYDGVALYKIKHFCVFVGAPRSGHTLISQLLNAHPDIVISDECVRTHFNVQTFRPPTCFPSKSSLFAQIWNKSRLDFKLRHKLYMGDYRYSVPNQWQGRVRRLKVIGDKCAYDTAVFIYRNPKYLDELAAFVKVPLKILHVVRNPFDTIARRYLKHKHRGGREADLQYWIHNHFEIICSSAMRAMDTMPESMLTLYSEDIIQNPSANLRTAVKFLGVRSNAQYERDCASIVWQKPSCPRQEMLWTKEAIHTVEENIRRVPFLAGRYAFGS